MFSELAKKELEAQGYVLASGCTNSYTDEEISVKIFAKSSKRKLDFTSKYIDFKFKEYGADTKTFSGKSEELIEQVRTTSILLKPKAESKKEEFIKVFKDAGLEHIFMEETQDGYCQGTHNIPWYIVTTSIGRIKIGFRKRVIHIDWSDSLAIDVDARDLFKEEDTTKDTNLIHAWTYEKASEYLKILKDSLKK